MPETVKPRFGGIRPSTVGNVANVSGRDEPETEPGVNFVDGRVIEAGGMR